MARPIPPASSLASAVVIVVLLISSGLAGPVAPDAPLEPRYYLDAEEVDSGEFARTHVPEPVYTDWYFAKAVTRADLSTTPEDGIRYRLDGSRPIVNGNMTALEQRPILLRGSVSVYRTASGKWVLSYPYKTTVETRNSRVYQSGEVELFRPTREIPG